MKILYLFCFLLATLKKVKMASFIQRFIDWIKSLFWKEEMELTLVGLQYSGKTTFVNVIAVGVAAARYHGAEEG